jgi:hypothetical protein
VVGALGSSAATDTRGVYGGWDSPSAACSFVNHGSAFLTLFQSKPICRRKVPELHVDDDDARCPARKTSPITRISVSIYRTQAMDSEARVLQGKGEIVEGGENDSASRARVKMAPGL